eukprot:ANDGO_01203.mRNA.1 Secretory immunoglobulin A-binding protein EsiB
MLLRAFLPVMRRSCVGSRACSGTVHLRCARLHSTKPSDASWDFQQASGARPSRRPVSASPASTRPPGGSAGVSAKVQAGNAHFQKQQFQDAYQSYVEAAESGDAMGMFNVGTMHLHGLGTAVDVNVAIEWIQKAYDKSKTASEGGCLSQAAFALGVLHIQVLKNKQRGLDLVSEAASKRNPDAITYIATQSFAEDPIMAIELLHHAADKEGSDLACYHLGLYYLTQRGHEERAEEFLTKAVKLGNVDAMVQLAQHHLKGGKLPFNEARSLTYTKLAAAKGHPEGLFALGMHAVSEHPRDAKVETEAVRMWMVAASRGHAGAHVALGNYFRRVVKDAKRAAHHYEIAHRLHSGAGTFNLAKCYTAGFGVDRDDGRAFQLVREAAEKSSVAEAMVVLANTFRYGDFHSVRVEPDMAAAMKWYDQAAALGNRDAQLALAALQNDPAKAKELLDSPHNTPSGMGVAEY